MKSLYFKNHGEINNILYGDQPEPALESGYAIIKVKYTAVNHLDLWVLNGWKGLNLPLPHIGGADIVGSISDLDNNKKNSHKVGDLVCINPGFITPGCTDNFIKLGKENLSQYYGIFGESCKGGFAEYVKVPICSIYNLSSPVKFQLSDQELQQLTGSLLVGLTAYRMLNDRAKLRAGETVLIVGGSGGLNSFTIKLAKFFGAKVIALSSSEEKLNFCTNLGADHVIDYSAIPNWSKRVKELTNGEGVNVVIDNVGSKSIIESIKACGKEGRIITVGNTSGHEISFDNRLLFTKQISIIGSTMGTFKNFSEVLKLILENKLFAPVDRVIPLNEGKTAYELISTGKQKGKLILDPTSIA